MDDASRKNEASALEMLDSPEAYVRVTGCESLRSADELSPKAVNALKEAVRDPDEHVRTAALAALKRHRIAPPQGPYISQTVRKSRRSSNGWIWILLSAFLVMGGLVAAVYFTGFKFDSIKSITALIPPALGGLAHTAVPEETATPQFTQITWLDLTAYLEADNSNLTKCSNDRYTCLNSSISMAAKANRDGLEAWVIGMKIENSLYGHAYVAFRTSDLGVVYIDPQNDVRYFTPQEGKPLCDVFGWYSCMGKVSQVTRLECRSVSDCDESPYKP